METEITKLSKLKMLYHQPHILENMGTEEL